MKNARIATSVVAGTAMVVLACGSAHAAPGAPTPTPPIEVDIAPGIHYRGSAADHSVVVDTPVGSLTTRGGDFQVLDHQGSLVAGTPITAPDAAQPEDTAPSTDTAAVRAPRADITTSSMASSQTTQAVDAPVDEPSQQAHNVDASADFTGALGVAATQFGLATGVGTLAGGVIGMGVGCVAGALTGGFVAIPTGPIAAPAAALGCVMGASVGAGLGGVTGAAVLGIPVGIASAVQMYNTLHAAGDI
ncbi:hypothetical protein [Nocardia spumae]|uniref:hypothetical protein n=1 Tax=Nocardia spumae TaxID=2887190 RepID=UPI001D157274|nr:hypothetical protein [Nocardia spumae]